MGGRPVTIPSIPNYCREDCNCTECVEKRHEHELAEAYEIAERHRPTDCRFDGDHR